jgi:CheY-like chemotaxis protein
MDKETLKRIFEPFFTTKFTGHGLGMSAVMGIIRSNGGALFVESEIGKGTTFKILFPESETVQPADVMQTVTIAERHSSGMPHVFTVLLVDDEKNVLRTCSKMVNLCGYKVITARDGKDAVNKYREHVDEIDAVLMDLTMPNMDGITAMNEIRTIKSDARVLLASGFNKDDMSSRFAKQSPSGFIRKPYSLSELEEKLKGILQFSE